MRCDTWCFAASMVDVPLLVLLFFRGTDRRFVMPFPSSGDQILGIGTAICDGLFGGPGWCPVRGINVGLQDKSLSCEVQGTPAGGLVYQVSKPGKDLNKTNFMYINHVDNGVAAGVLNSRLVDQYVYSDNFAGCEFHVLAKEGQKKGAFLHVYRSNGRTITYGADEGWFIRASIPTAGLLQPGKGLSIVAFAFVAGGSNKATCGVLSLDNKGMVARVEAKKEFELSWG
jgi:hypothetical protein